MDVTAKIITQFVKDLSFEIKNSGFGVIEGESGIGKTTLLNFIAGLKKPHSGEIILNNRILSSPLPCSY